MDFISNFFSSKLSDHYQLYFNKLPYDAQQILKKKVKKDQEKLLDTFSQQSEYRIELIVSILSQQSIEVLDHLFTKETRLLKALMKIETNYMEEYAKKPDDITNMIMNKK